jgi:hypothetical protein
MVAQEWDGRKLASSVYFEPYELGLDLFSAYLESLRNQPVRLLVDLIEEEFRQITIPLLRGPDRTEIVERNLNKYFRNTRYRHALTQGVIKEKGRKEERLLLMGLTNPQLLEPWLQLIEKQRVPISGILSLPLLSEGLVERFKAEQRCVILVSQQVPSNLRQSVFLDGKLILSRLVPIASFYQGDYARDVVRDVESTQRYLVSQRIIDRSDVVGVQVLTNKRHLQKLREQVAGDSYFDYQIHEINQVLEEEKIEVPEEQDFSSALFCFQATRGLYVNHYAQRPEKKYFYHHVAGFAAKFAGVAVLAVALGLFASSLIKGWLYDDSIEEMKLLQQKYESKYKQLSLTRAGSDVSTAMMQNVVKTVEKLKRNYQQRPQEMMILVSQQVSLYDSMRIKEYEWFLAPGSDVTSASEASWDKPKRKRRARRDRNQPRPKKGLFEIAVFTGEIMDFDGNYRYALSAVDDLEDAMRVSGWYDQVEVLKRPLDVESEKQLSGELGVGTRREKGKAEFTIRVVRKVKTNEQ